MKKLLNLLSTFGGKDHTACISNLLKLISSMIKENHKYSYKQEHLSELALLEEQYKEFKKKENPSI